MVEADRDREVRDGKRKEVKLNQKNGQETAPESALKRTRFLIAGRCKSSGNLLMTTIS
jgi:hypothetical protein